VARADVHRVHIVARQDLVVCSERRGPVRSGEGLGAVDGRAAHRVKDAVSRGPEAHREVSADRARPEDRPSRLQLRHSSMLSRRRCADEAGDQAAADLIRGTRQVRGSAAWATLERAWFVVIALDLGCGLHRDGRDTQEQRDELAPPAGPTRGLLVHIVSFIGRLRLTLPRRSRGVRRGEP
jgi:hypothetical protein